MTIASYRVISTRIMRKLAVVFGLIIHLCTSAYAGKGNGIDAVYDCKMTIDPNQPTMGTPQLFCVPSGQSQGATPSFGLGGNSAGVGGGGGGTPSPGIIGPGFNSGASSGFASMGWNGPNGSAGFPGATGASGTSPFAGHVHNTAGVMQQQQYAAQGYARLNHANHVINQSIDAIPKAMQAYKEQYEYQIQLANEGYDLDFTNMTTALQEGERLYNQANQAFHHEFGTGMHMVNNPKHDSDYAIVGRACRDRMSKAREDLDKAWQKFADNKELLEALRKENLQIKEEKAEVQDVIAKDIAFENSPEGKAAYEDRTYVSKEASYARNRLDNMQGISISKEGADFVRDELDLAEGLSKDATQYLKGGISATAKLMMDLAIDTVHAANNFLDGVGNGVYNGFAQASDAIVAIAKDPTLVTNLSNNLMYTLSGGPKATYEVAKAALSHGMQTMMIYQQAFWYGSATDKGEALGQLAVDLIMEAFPLSAVVKMPYKHVKWLGGPINKNIRELVKPFRQAPNPDMGKKIADHLLYNTRTTKHILLEERGFNSKVVMETAKHLYECIQVRNLYHKGMKDIHAAHAQMLNKGHTTKEIAEHLYQMRRDLGEKMKDLTPESVRNHIYEANIKMYGDPLGPKLEKMLEDGKSYEDIIRSATKTNPAVDAFIEEAKKWLDLH